MSCVDSLVFNLRKVVMLILHDTVDDKSLEGLLRHIINSKFNKLEAFLRFKIDEPLKPQRKGYSITYNYYFIDYI